MAFRGEVGLAASHEITEWPVWPAASGLQHANDRVFGSGRGDELIFQTP